MLERNVGRTTGPGPAMASLAALMLLASGPATSAEYSLVIHFDGECPTMVEDAGNSCGDDVEDNKACAKRKDKLVWTSKPEGKDFTLYFDPLKGGPKHKSQGGTYDRHIDEKIPVNVEYKYTVVGKECPEKPHDPRIVIRPD